MGHQTDTPNKLPAVPQNYLLKRGSRYYFRIKVPVDLQESMGRKELKWSLGTSDHRQACRLVKLEAVKAEGRFEAESVVLDRDRPNQRIPLEIKGDVNIVCFRV